MLDIAGGSGVHEAVFDDSEQAIRGGCANIRPFL
jgi:hypothetical protein